MVSNDTLIDVVTRLENCIKELKGDSNIKIETVDKAEEEKPIIRPFTEFWTKAKESMQMMIENAKTSTLGEPLVRITEIAIEAICLHQDILYNQEHFKPLVDSETGIIQSKFMELIKKVEKIGLEQREIEQHSKSIVTGINTLFWCTIKDDCGEVAQQYSEMIDVSRNKIVIKKIQEETNWVKAWKDIFLNLVKLVKMEYKVGLPYNFKSEKIFKEFQEKLGENFKYYTDNKKFKVLCSSNTKVVKSKQEEKKEVTKEVKTTKNTEFLNLMKANFSKMLKISRGAGIDKFEDLTIEIGRAYGILAHLLDNANKYRLPKEDDMKRISQIFLDKVKLIKDYNSPDLALFKDNAENVLNSLHWITKNEQCEEIAQFYVEMCDHSGNKIFMKKVPELTDWIKSNKELLKKMQFDIKQYYKAGLDWNYKGGNDNFDELLKDLEKSTNFLFSEIPVQSNNDDCQCYELSKSGLNKIETCSIKSCSEGCVEIEESNGSKLKLTVGVKCIKISNCSNIKIHLFTCDSITIGVFNSKQIEIICCEKTYSI